MTTETTFAFPVPISLQVGVALMQAIGVIWPEAQIRQTASGPQVVLPAPDAAPDADRALREILPELLDPEADPHAVLERWSAGDIEISMSAKSEAQQRLAAWALIMLKSFDAANYVEQEVQVNDPDGTQRRLHVSASWTRDQSPHHLLRQAQDEIAALNARLAALGDVSAVGEHEATA